MPSVDCFARRERGLRGQSYCAGSSSHVDEKYNAPPKEVVLSEEDIHTLESFRTSLLCITELMNVSVVDKNDISGILDVGTGALLQS